MKKIFLCIVLLITLVGCSNNSKVQRLANWHFQKNSNDDGYSLFFELRSKDGKSISADGNIWISITDKNGEILYEDTIQFTQKDFGNYTSESDGEQYLCNIRIDSDSIKPGNSQDGTVSFIVSNDYYYSFEQVDIDVYYKLPVKETKIIANEVPLKLNHSSYFYDYEIRIDSIDFSNEEGILQNYVKVTIIGEVINNKGNSTISFDYKLLDSSGFVVDTGTIRLSSLSAGDKFKEELNLYEIIPGDCMRIKFFAD